MISEYTKKWNDEKKKQVAERRKSVGVGISCDRRNVFIANKKRKRKRKRRKKKMEKKRRKERRGRIVNIQIQVNPLNLLPKS